MVNFLSSFHFPIFFFLSVVVFLCRWCHILHEVVGWWRCGCSHGWSWWNFRPSRACVDPRVLTFSHRGVGELKILKILIRIRIRSGWLDGVKWGWLSCSVSSWLGRFGCGGGLVNLEEWWRKKRGEKNKKKNKKNGERKTKEINVLML